MSRVLVTGAAGFIGLHLVDRLLKTGHDVMGMDCFTDYYSREVKRQNLYRAFTYDRFRFLEGDLLRLDLNELVCEIDKVVHLAGEPGVRSSWGERFSIYMERNVQTTQRLLEAACVGGLEHLVYASSSSVYGPDRGGPVKEDAPRRPASPYGLSKLAAEELVGLYGREWGGRRWFSGTSRCMDRASDRRWRFRALSRSPLAGKPSRFSGTGAKCAR